MELKNYDAGKIEEFILDFWDKKGIYKIAKSKGKKKFYFLDGPPYTSGQIHLGIAWNKSLKDCVVRYKRMKGFNVWDRAGYDMHGLPTEHRVEEKLGIKHKDEILKFGIKGFVEECKKLSIENMNLMNKDFRRLGVWLDFENAYQSIKNEFMEGEWWLCKKAFENKRLYEGLKTMHWCAKCGTALAKHELEYENVKDDSIFVKFHVKGKDKEFLIIWTTTPWTLAFNLGVMAHPEIDYVKAKVDDEVWIMAKELANMFISSIDKKFTIIEEFKGEKLIGLKYEHFWKDEIKPFSEIKSEKLHTVVMSEEYVDLSAGTGLVHMAPGCGPEDYEVGHREGLPPFNNIDETGRFPGNMGKFSGLVTKENDDKFVEALGEHLIKTAPVEHEYAHCWRCHKPVVFRTTKQWFFKVEDLKEKMRKLNKKVFWQPDWAGSNWFDSWLDNLRDNGITRQRYWGTPVPIWKCDKCNDYVVIGSRKELSELAKNVPEDLHKPYIDEVTIPCKCGSVKRRIPDILDVWIDAGTASWTCLDYPHREDLFNELWPPDFILEGKDQIRGWFNLLFVASMVSMKKHSYKAVYMHGFVQDAQGRKMSKSLGNIISPYEVIDKYGSDTLRFYMIGGANPGLDINYNFDDIKTKHKSLMVLWNLHNYVVDLARVSKQNPAKLKIKNIGLEERYIISRMNSTIKEVTELFEKYMLNEIALKVENLFLDLSRVYIQLVRNKVNSDETEVVLYATYNVLLNVLKIFAPIAPLITEAMYQNLKEEFVLKEESVHLFSWPNHDETKIDKSLEKNMDICQKIIQAILFARERSGIGVRWPVKECLIVAKDIDNIVKEFDKSIKGQTNVKELKIVAEAKGDLEKVEFSNGAVYLNKERTPELEAEGFAREIMRRVQILRKKAGLKKDDRIELFIKADKDLIESWGESIMKRVGAEKIIFGENVENKISSKFSLKNREFGIGFSVLTAK